MYHCLVGTSLMVDSNNHQILLNPYLCHITSFLFWFGESEEEDGRRSWGLPLLFHLLHGEHGGNTESY